MNAKLTTLIAGLALAFSAASRAQNAWDNAGDFSLASNPNGAWSYGWQMPDGNFNLMTFTKVDCGSIGLSCWKRFEGDWDLPKVEINTTGAPLEFSSGVIPVNVLNLHPNATGERSVVMWTAPVDGSYAITGQFQAADRTPTGVQVIVNVNGVEVLSKPLKKFGQAVQFNLHPVLSAGQAVSFAVDPAGNFANDSTVLRVGVLRLK